MIPPHKRKRPKSDGTDGSWDPSDGMEWGPGSGGDYSQEGAPPPPITQPRAPAARAAPLPARPRAGAAVGRGSKADGGGRRGRGADKARTTRHLRSPPLPRSRLKRPVPFLAPPHLTPTAPLRLCKLGSSYHPGKQVPEPEEEGDHESTEVGRILAQKETLRGFQQVFFQEKITRAVLLRTWEPEVRGTRDSFP